MDFEIDIVEDTEIEFVDRDVVVKQFNTLSSNFTERLRVKTERVAALEEENKGLKNFINSLMQFEAMP